MLFEYFYQPFSQFRVPGWVNKRVDLYGLCHMGSQKLDFLKTK